MRVLALALTLGATAHGARDCPDLAPVMLIHDGNYGPGGHGPSFTVDLRADGKVLFRTNEWLCPSGVYTGSLSRQDFELLSCLIGDLFSTPALPAACGGLHAPGFMIVTPRTGEGVGTCVGLIPGSAFEQVYSLLPKALLRADLKPFVLSMVLNRPALEGPLAATPDDDPGFKLEGVVTPDRGPISAGIPLPPIAVIFKGCRVTRPATFKVLVNEDGHPRSARLLKSSGCSGADHRLRAAILDAWFHPAMKDSRFSRGSLLVTVPTTAPEANPSQSPVHHIQ
jgi:hypothetical protein